MPPFEYSSAGPIRVILAEDDEDHVLLLRRALRGFPRPIELLVARDGREALQVMSAESPPDLILLDINMPKLTGLEVLRAIKTPDSKLVDVPTIMLTTSARDEDRRASLEGGAAEFLTKPVNFKQFSATLQQLLTRHFPEQDLKDPKD